MIYILYILAILIIAIIAIGQYVSYTKTYYTDAAISKLRQLQFEATIYLSENVQTMPIEKAGEIRNLITITGASLHLLQSFGAMKFGLLKKIIVAIIACTKQINAIKNSPETDEKLQYFSKKYWIALSLSFEAIPLLRIRLILLLTRWVSELFVMIGIGAFKGVAVGIDEITKAKNDIHNHCLG